jgi:hypothetical protein
MILPANHELTMRANYGDRLRDKQKEEDRIIAKIWGRKVAGK